MQETMEKPENLFIRFFVRCFSKRLDGSKWGCEIKQVKSKLGRVVSSSREQKFNWANKATKTE